MRNIRICQRSCLQCRVVLAANKQEVLYQCRRDTDFDGNLQGPYPFDLVTRLELPQGCDREFDQKVMGEGTILDEVSADVYGVSKGTVQRFISLCADCRCFTSELDEESGRQSLCCDQDVLHKVDAKSGTQAPSFLTRPVPDKCPYRHEQKTLKMRFQ